MKAVGRRRRAAAQHPRLGNAKRDPGARKGRRLGNAKREPGARRKKGEKMARLYRFDYKSPYYYMVTLKRLAKMKDFCRIADNGTVVKNETTDAFVKIIRNFHKIWRCIEPISPYAIMPDHIHLMIKIKPMPERVALGVIVSQLMKALRNAYWEGGAAAPPRKTHALIAQSESEAREGQDGAAAPPRKTHALIAQSENQAMERQIAFEARSENEARVLRGGASAPPPVFNAEWHDWIVKTDGQLAAFGRYIRENAKRHALRRQNSRYFGRVSRVKFLGREWFAYGNTAILDLPQITPFKGHRATTENSDEWNALLSTAARIGPGGAGISTFMSPLEKACGNAIARAGGRLVVLSPEGFAPRWHPPREKEKFCAAGRMLFLSLYEPSPRKLTKQELYDRCHEMIDWVSRPVD